jgi:bacillolysin
MYSNESGAIHEALCDIFGIQVKRLAAAAVSSAADPSLWYIADKVTVSGQGIRDMADPASRNHSDYYPTRYQGGSPNHDNGGVHWNSGIANLAFYLFVNGGTHPRGKTSVVVKGLIEILGGNEDEAFQAAGDIFFCTAWSCLTSQSSFADLRLCTTTICGSTGRLQDDEIISSMKDAWDAVGVLENSIPNVIVAPQSSAPPTSPPTIAPAVTDPTPTAAGTGPAAPTFAATPTAGLHQHSHSQL